MAKARTGSSLLLDEMFSSQDEQFLPTFRDLLDGALLATFADKWVKDVRPSAQEQLLKYLDEPIDSAAIDRW